MARFCSAIPWQRWQARACAALTHGQGPRIALARQPRSAEESERAWRWSGDRPAKLWYGYWRAKFVPWFSLSSPWCTVHKKLFFLLYVTCYLCWPAHADDNKKYYTMEDLRAGRAPLTTVSPIFGELVAFRMPGNFKIVTEEVKGAFYIREAVLKNETAFHWSQMITVTGAKGLAGNPNLNPRKMAEQIVTGFKPACPTTFSEQSLGALTISGHDGYATLASCGTVQNGGYTHSEAALLIFIKGAQDYYTLQWAERGAATEASADLSDARWQDRLKTLNPILICKRVAGEPPPYPSCIQQQ